jgi:sucrose-6F-phosphate phosphohydrolase
LVYNSGRLFESVSESVRRSALPEPDAIIGGVGTEIREFSTGAAVGCWPESSPGWQPARIIDILAESGGLCLQPAEFLSHYKISYFGYDFTAQQIAELQTRLHRAGCAVEIVYSSGRDLDVLPAGVNKGSAAAYLARHWGFTTDDVIVSGDSENDMAMFERHFRGIVVANAHAPLRRLQSPRIYQARHAFAKGVREGLVYWLGLQ